MRLPNLYDDKCHDDYEPLLPSNRDKLSTASSYLSLMLEHPKRYLEDRCGFFLALSSGLLLTFYSTLYKTIQEDIARGSVLLLRGSMQVSANSQLTTTAKAA